MIKPGETKRRPHGSTKELILDVAEELIGRDGFAAFRLRDIAEPLGIRVPSIYSHFAGRDAVCAGVAERYVKALAGQFPFDEEESPTEAILEGVRGLVHLYAYNPAYARIKIRDLETPGGIPHLNLAAEGSPNENLLDGPLSDLYTRLQRILECGSERGEFRKIDLVRFMRTMVGTIILSLTWPDQSLLGGAPAPNEIEQIASEAEELTILLLGIER